jgi:hypothetical protein
MRDTNLMTRVNYDPFAELREGAIDHGGRPMRWRSL